MKAPATANAALALKRWTEVKTGMLLHAPFFVSFLLDHMEVMVGKFAILGPMATAGTDGRRLWADEDYLATLNLKQAVFLFCHEVGHCILQHMARGKKYEATGIDGEPFDHDLYNMAADYVINDMLIESNIGEMPPGGLHDSRYKWTMLVDDVYRDLKKRGMGKKKPPPGQGQGNQPGQGQGQGGQPGQDNRPTRSPGTLDTHVYEPSHVSKADMKRMIKSAANAAKAMGKLPSNLEIWIEGVLNPKICWKERFRTLVGRAISRESTTWRTPHKRRLVSQGIYMPSYTGFKAGVLVYGQDTSGSMLGEPIKLGRAELAGIIRDCMPERVYVVPCDAQVHEVTVLEEGDDLELINIPMRGGGGTSFVPVFDWIEEEGIEPAALVYFTDTYGSFPSKAPKYPVIWVTDQAEGTVKVPFGELVHIETAQQEDE